MENFISLKMFSEISNVIATEQSLFKFGHELKISLNDIQRIWTTRKGELKSCTSEIIQLYLKRNDNCKTAEQFLKVILEAFHHSQMGFLIRKIYQENKINMETYELNLKRELRQNEKEEWRIEHLLLLISETFPPTDLQFIVTCENILTFGWEQTTLFLLHKDPWRQNLSMLQLLRNAYPYDDHAFLRQIIRGGKELQRIGFIRNLFTESGLEEHLTQG